MSKIIFFTFTSLLTCIFGCTTVVPTLIPSKTRLPEFLEHFVKAYPIVSRINIEFTGKYKDIPKDLNERLMSSFPSLRFHIAKMRYQDWGMSPVNLIVIVDAKSSYVVTYMWDIWFDDPPSSFQAQFGRLFRTGEDSETQLSSLASLIAYSMEGSTDPLKKVDDAIEVPIRDMHNTEWRTLRLVCHNNCRQNDILLINPKATSDKSDAVDGK